MYWLLLYDYVDDYLQRRDEFRSAHLALLREGMARGEVFMGGALVEAPPQGVIVFTSQSAAEAFVADDPYVHNGIVAQHTLREWHIVSPE